MNNEFDLQQTANIVYEEILNDHPHLARAPALRDRRKRVLREVELVGKEACN